MSWEDQKDKYLISHALLMWANHIETGDICLNAIDAKKMGKEKQINALDVDQMKLVVRLKELSNKQLETN
jgi:hypothetical protein